MDDINVLSSNLSANLLLSEKAVIGISMTVGNALIGNQMFGDENILGASNSIRHLGNYRNILSDEFDLNVIQI